MNNVYKPKQYKCEDDKKRREMMSKRYNID